MVSLEFTSSAALLEIWQRRVDPYPRHKALAGRPHLRQPRHFLFRSPIFFYYIPRATPLAPPPPYPPKPVDGPTGVDGSSPETASFCLLWLTRSSGVFWCRSVGRGECGPLVVRNLRVGMSRGRVAHAAFDAVRVRVRGARERRRNIRVENQKNMEQKE